MRLSGGMKHETASMMAEARGCGSLLSRKGRAGIVALLCAMALLGTSPVFPQKMPKLETREGTRPGHRAHAFNLKDLDGKPYDLKMMNENGRVVHVVFWATWCFPCIEEIPHLREAYAKYRERGLEVLGIVMNINQTREGVRSFMEDYEINYPILWDDGQIAQRYNVSQIPQNFLIGKDGIILHSGSSLPSDYHAVLEKMLGMNGAGD